MIGKKVSHAHLRVRISDSDKDFLFKLSAKGGRQPNISREVKALIRAARQERLSVPVSKETLRRIRELAQLLSRTQTQVTDEAISAIFEMAVKGETPLIVMELHLAKKYFGTPARHLRNKL